MVIPIGSMVWYMLENRETAQNTPSTIFEQNIGTIQKEKTLCAPKPQNIGE